MFVAMQHSDWCIRGCDAKLSQTSIDAGDAGMDWVRGEGAMNGCPHREIVDEICSPNSSLIIRL